MEFCPICIVREAIDWKAESGASSSGKTRGALLSVLIHFFENLQWNSPVETGLEEQSLTAEDQLCILAQAALHLTATRGMGANAFTLWRRSREPLHAEPPQLWQSRYTLWAISNQLLG
jgi:hypothetical protein